MAITPKLNEVGLAQVWGKAYNTFALKSYVESIVVGGRNYCRNNNYWITSNPTYMKFTHNDDGSIIITKLEVANAKHCYLPFSKVLKIGETYTLTVRARATSAKTEVTIVTPCNTTEASMLGEYSINMEPSDEYVTKSVTFTVTTYCDGLCVTSSSLDVNDTIDILWIQIEKGNMATDWKPNPDDDISAASADKLSTSAGSATQPVYFSDGKPVACNYTLNKSVPSDAVFTDTTYSIGNTTTAGIGKLYTGTGTNADGSMTQNAITSKLGEKAPLVSPALTGTPTAPTASTGTNTTQIATTAFVQTAVSNGIAASDAMIVKGTIGTSGTVTALPTTYSTGWTYRVVTAGTYAGQVCEIGDLIIALVDRKGTGNTNSDWCVAQTNINGAITGVKSGDAYIDYSQSGSVVTITHKNVTRTNTTSTSNPTHGGTFTAVKSITSDEKGHVTGVDTETVKLPNAYTHPSYTARTGVPTANQTPTFGGTFSITQPVSDTTGHITAMNSRTITIPNSVATTSAAGLMSASDKTKLDGIATSAEVNQNAFSNVVVGSTTIAADSKTDSLTLAGSNVTLTPDAANDKVTIGITKDNVVSALGYTPPTTNTTYSTGTASSAGLTKLYTGTGTNTDGSMTQNAITTALNGKAPSSHGTHVTYGTSASALGTSSAGSAATVSRSVHVHALPALTSCTGTLTVAKGGTGATDAATARTNLGITPANIGAATSSHTHNYAGSSSAGGAANNALKLSGYSISTAGTTDVWGTIPSIGGSDGVMEVGKYLDFHVSDDSTVDYDVRVIAETSGLTLGGTTKGTFSGSLSGNASTATALTTSAGSATQPVYFSSGKPVACTYSLNKSVPSNAVFTDTTYSIGNTTTAGIGKLYEGTGTATDGSMTQSAITTAVNNARSVASQTVDINEINESMLMTYYVPFTAIGKAYELKANDGIRYIHQQGSGSSTNGTQIGSAILQLGNSSYSNTSGNKQGILRLYSHLGAYVDLKTEPVSPSASYTLKLPGASGTLATEDKVDTKLSSYLPLDGGSMNGVLNTQNLLPDSPGSGRSVGAHGNPYNNGFFNYVYSTHFGLTDSSGNSWASIGYNGSYDVMYYSGNNIDDPKYDVVGLHIYSGVNYNMRLHGKNIRLQSENYISSNVTIAMASDEKVKSFTEDIKTDEEKLIKLFDIIKPKSYSYKYLKSDSVNIGFSAQEIEQAMIDLGIDPEKYGILHIQYGHIVSRGSDFEDGKYYTKFYEISYNDLFNLSLLKTHMMEKEHVERLNSLERELSDVKTKLDSVLSILQNN